jgi:hypothetical protein
VVIPTLLEHRYPETKLGRAQRRSHSSEARPDDDEILAVRHRVV